VTVRTSPSIALIKYWGKKGETGTVPATSSLAVTLSSLWTESRIEAGNADTVILNGEAQDPERFRDFFDRARDKIGENIRFTCRSFNNFPTASGLASSSSGFAALALGINALTGRTLPPQEVSSLAREGSASAARAVYGGFTSLPAGAQWASQLHGETFWPELRVIVVSVHTQKKPLSSRDAMKISKETSPYFESWIKDSESLYTSALKALEKKDLPVLGPLMRKSYMRMFSTMFSSDPPLIYWLPDSLGMLHLCARLRAEGTPAWETMDAGPQVKIFCLRDDADVIARRVAEEYPDCFVHIDQAGPGPVILEGA